MARKALIEKEKRRINLVEKNWEKRAKLKKILADPTSSEEDFKKARRDLSKMSPNTSPVRVRNRCQLTGRPRGFLSKFQISRNCFRELASKGMIPGVTKASW